MSYADPALTSSEFEAWETPPAVFAWAEDLFGTFDLDAAASESNHLCDEYLHEGGRSAFVNDWGREDALIWCNPPYGKQLPAWIDRIEQQLRDSYRRIVLLVPARTDTKWFRRAWQMSMRCIFISGRLKYRIGGEELDPAPFPSALMYLGSRYLSGTDPVCSVNPVPQRDQPSLPLEDR